MSDKSQQPIVPQRITLNELVLTSEDVNKFDLILGGLPYRTVKPLFDILNTRIEEQAAMKLKASANVFPSITQTKETQQVRSLE